MAFKHLWTSTLLCLLPFLVVTAQDVTVHYPFPLDKKQPEKIDDLLLFKEPNGTLHFREDLGKYLPDFSGENIFGKYAYLFDIDKNYEFKKKFVNTGNQTFRGVSDTYFFDLYYKGYLLQRNAASFDERDGIIFEGGYIVPEIDYDLSAVISEKEAIQTAISATTSGTPMWELWANGNHPPETHPYFPKGKLHWLLWEDKYGLYYEVKVVVKEKNDTKTYVHFVNAESGEVDFSR